MNRIRHLFDITTDILNKINSVLAKTSLDIVFVNGNSITTFVTALSCFYLKIPVGRTHMIFILYFQRDLIYNQ
ncbi:hypothetical protein [Vagococcus lutrae]|uniref:hypothetical protein n=1 Tax=Vagococcus lutrae TaxID=81947 RepID=UPI0028907903|nr:hypothetical protein [Vagococcus lutrae]MDT2808522.1 hypothetical protein [Vagococcus lutrae]